MKTQDISDLAKLINHLKAELDDDSNEELSYYINREIQIAQQVIDAAIERECKHLIPALIQ